MTTANSRANVETNGTRALVDVARAKVNLTLRVLGRRLDGYHELESVVAFADCADQLDLTPGPQLNLRTNGPLAQECGEIADNLVLRAGRLLSERVPGLKVGEFTLGKVLPVAAGIGGGSADAAAALRLLAQLNHLALNDPRLIEVARSTGADVPVCLGSRPCVMTGIGEDLVPLGLPELPCVLVNPRVPVATKDVFEKLGLHKGQLSVGLGEVIEAVTWPREGASPGEWIESLAAGVNDLEAPALRVQPAIGDVLSALSQTEGPRLVRMSGSGATCFAIFENGNDARRGGDKIRFDHPSWWVHAGTLS
jgi:4-diphosphocytidyl-2-C-methyl-D-erythritol kinase